MSNGLTLLKDIHSFVVDSVSSNQTLIRGSYYYWHYLVDGFNDKGWGCAYRSFQTIFSWYSTNYSEKYSKIKVPTHQEIQKALVEMGDKPPNFVDSKEWIGSFEICLCLDHFLNVSSKILHCANGRNVLDHLDKLEEHFVKIATPVMIGGTSGGAMTLLGIRKEKNQIYFLIADPHYVSPRNYSLKKKDVSNMGTDEADLTNILGEGWVAWKDPSTVFLPGCWYNFCLPQLPPSNYQKALVQSFVFQTFVIS